MLIINNDKHFNVINIFLNVTNLRTHESAFSIAIIKSSTIFKTIIILYFSNINKHCNCKFSFNQIRSAVLNSK